MQLGYTLPTSWLLNDSRPVPVFGQVTAAGSEFANKHGIYLGRRSTKIHVALYRRSSGSRGETWGRRTQAAAKDDALGTRPDRL
jgi:hypothetical protein